MLKVASSVTKNLVAFQFVVVSNVRSRNIPGRMAVSCYGCGPNQRRKLATTWGWKRLRPRSLRHLGAPGWCKGACVCVCVFFCSHTFLCLQGPCQPGCFLQVPFRNQSAGKNPFYLSVSSWKNQMAKNVLMSIRWQSSLALQQGQNFGFSLILVCLVWQGSWSLSLRHVRRNLHAVCSGKPNCRDVLRKVCRHHPISLG